MFRKIEFIGLHLLIKGWVNLIWAKYRLFLIVFSAELINGWISEVIFNMLSISNRILNFYFFWWLWNQFSVFVLLEFSLTLFCALIFIDKVFPGVMIVEEPQWRDCIQGSTAVVNLAGTPIGTRWSSEVNIANWLKFIASADLLFIFQITKELLLWERRWLICSHLSLATTSLYDLLSRHILLKSNS